jgi:hypothetical protein
MSFICKICSQSFEEIPADAIKIGEKRCGYQLYRFPGREAVIHDLKVAYPERFSHRTHLRWHVNRNITKPDCGHCNRPKPATELLAATIQALSELPTPVSEHPPETAMSIAFRKSSKAIKRVWLPEHCAM